MRSTVFVIFAIAVTVLAESFPNPEYSRLPASYMNRRPSARPRFARSADPEPQGVFNANLQRNSLNLDYQHNIIDNNRGSLNARAEVQKIPGQNWMSNVGLQGTYRFPEQNPRGSITATWQKSFSGPERRPSYSVDYDHTIFQNRHGSIGVTAGAQKSPGQRWQGNIGLGGRFRFRRSAESEFEKEINRQE